MLFPDIYQFFESYFTGKSHQAEIAGMHPHQGDRPRADRLFKVVGVGAIGGPHFNKLGAALPHDIGNAKATAYLHCLTP